MGWDQHPPQFPRSNQLGFGMERARNRILPVMISLFLSLLDSLVFASMGHEKAATG